MRCHVRGSCVERVLGSCVCVCDLHGRVRLKVCALYCFGMLLTRILQTCGSPLVSAASFPTVRSSAVRSQFAQIDRNIFDLTKFLRSHCVAPRSILLFHEGGCGVLSRVLPGRPPQAPHAARAILHHALTRLVVALSREAAPAAFAVFRGGCVATVRTPSHTTHIHNNTNNNPHICPCK